MITWILLLLLGWSIGALVNYCADVLPNKRRFIYPECINCNTRFSILNYLFFPRKCDNCGTNRAYRTWIVESVYILIVIILWLNIPENIGFWLSLLLFFYFGIITIIDIEHHLILHFTSLFGLIIGLGIGIKLHGLYPTILGGLAGFAGMLILYFLGIGFSFLSSKFRNKPIEEEALGFGDVNLCGIIGLILGWPGIVAGLLLAIIIGGFVSLIYIAYLLISKNYHPNMALPYGPFIIASAIFLLFFKDLLI
jgi:leader peptidase (prepilin peptidase)/N-methyltransferase